MEAKHRMALPSPHKTSLKEIYLYPGQLYATTTPTVVSTVLGSCIAVCLWDSARQIGGINHYMLPFWNGEGRRSPRYGNIAIPMLVARMEQHGAHKNNMIAKIFGGGAVLQGANGLMDVGERNIALAHETLQEAGLTIASSHVGEDFGRKILFNTLTAEVKMKRIIRGSGLHI